MVEKYTLKNGIPLYIVESHASPVASIQAWVTRGSIHESDKLAGISHFLEHALFKGTKRRKVGQLASDIESRGGEINAFTSFEETAFYATLASRYFSEGLDVIADMMQNPLFDKDEMIREREVILEEIKRAHDSPYKVVSMNLWQAAFPNSPFGRPVLGFEETVKKINHDTLRRYFDQHYHTGTMCIIVVGDVDKRETLELVQSRFNKVKLGKNSELFTPRILPNITVPKVVSASREVKECHIQIGIPAPKITDPMVPALDLVCSAIGSGESSRLYQKLVKELRLAHEAHFGLVATKHCGLVNLTIMAAPENMEAAIREGIAVIHQAAREGLEPAEIERVKSSLESDVVSGKETVEGYARRLGYYHVEFGDPEYEGKYLQSILSVDRARTADALFSILERKPVVSIIHPTEMKVDRKKISQLASRPMLRKVAGKLVRNVPQLTTKGNVRYITKVEESLPAISLRMIFRSGSREERPNEYGVGTLFGRLWTSGTRSFDAFQISQTLESLGASISGFVGRNTSGIAVECLSKHWKIIQPFVNEILLHPTFPEKEFLTEKELTLREILSERDVPGATCQLNFMKMLYGDHPYGRSSQGTKESVTGLTVANLQDYYKSFIHSKNLVISTVGDIDRDRWINDLSPMLEQLPSGGRAHVAAFKLQRPDKLNILVEKKEPLFQSHVMIGFLGASFKDPERYALKLLSSCLAGQGGRLFLELRDKQSLAYQVAPVNSDGPEPGVFGFYIGCSPEKVERALTGIRIEIDKILNAPMDRKELERSKEYWIGRFELDMQRYGAQSMLFGLDEVYDQGFDHSYHVPEIIKGITAKEVQEAARKFLTPDTATISIVHNKELDTAVVQRAWEVKGKLVAVPPTKKPREKAASRSI